MSGKLFLGGVPTKPDVDRLMELEITPGSCVTYEEIEQATGLKYRTARFEAVVATWKKRLLREKGLQIKREGGAVHFLTDDQASDEGGTKLVRAGRATGRAVRDISMVRENQLTTDERRRRHGLMKREARALLEHHQSASKTIAGPEPIKSRPFPRAV